MSTRVHRSFSRLMATKPAGTLPRSDYKVVIVGAGVIGASTALHLSRLGLGHRVTVVERCGVACAASGGAGGFLARDWCGGALLPFNKLSFDLHRQLAEDLKSVSCADPFVLASGDDSCAAAHKPEVDGSTAPARGSGAGGGAGAGAGAGNTRATVNDLAGRATGVDYRGVDTRGIEATPVGAKQSGRGAHSTASRPALSAAQASILPDWVTTEACTRVSDMGDPTTTAQVHPAKLTRAMLNAAMASGVKLVKGCAVGIAVADTGAEHSSDGHPTPHVCGVRIVTPDTKAETVLPATAVVLAMGPWTSRGLEWFADACKAHAPTAGAARGRGRRRRVAAGCLRGSVVTGQKAHSIRLCPAATTAAARTPPAITATALFVEYDSAGGVGSSPEIYPRPDGEVYVCGGTDDAARLPDDPADVAPAAAACEALAEFAAVMSPAALAAAAGATVVGRGACYLPCSADGSPLIGVVPGAVSGGFLAAGHSCWGILGAPATGRALALSVRQFLASYEHQTATAEVGVGARGSSKRARIGSRPDATDEAHAHLDVDVEVHVDTSRDVAGGAATGASSSRIDAALLELLPAFDPARLV